VQVDKIRQKSQKFMHKYNKLENRTEYNRYTTARGQYVAYWFFLPLPTGDVNRNDQIGVNSQAPGGHALLAPVPCIAGDATDILKLATLSSACVLLSIVHRFLVCHYLVIHFQHFLLNLGIF